MRNCLATPKAPLREIVRPPPSHVLLDTGRLTSLTTTCFSILQPVLTFDSVHTPLSLHADAEKSINNILDYVGGEGKGYGVETTTGTLERFYEVTKQSLEESRNEVRSSLPFQIDCCLVRQPLIPPLRYCAWLTAQSA